MPVMVAVGAAAVVAGAGPRAFGSIPLAFLWQPVTAPSATRVAAIARVLLILFCIALIGYLLPSLVFQKNQLPAKWSHREEQLTSSSSWACRRRGPLVRVSVFRRPAWS